MALTLIKAVTVPQLDAYRWWFTAAIACWLFFHAVSRVLDAIEDWRARTATRSETPPSDARRRPAAGTGDSPASFSSRRSS